MLLFQNVNYGQNRKKTALTSSFCRLRSRKIAVRSTKWLAGVILLSAGTDPICEENKFSY